MGIGWKNWFWLLAILLLGSPLWGQEEGVVSVQVDSLERSRPILSSDSVESEAFDPESIFGKIAPLEELIDRAIVHAASLKLQDEVLMEQLLKYRIEKKQWLQYFSLQGQASYGTGSGLTAIDNGTIVASRVTNQTNLLYNGGLALKINPEYWANRKNNLRVLESKMAQTKATKRIIIQQIRELVVQRYQAVYNSLALVKLHAGALETGRIAHESATLFFERGDMTITELDASLRYKAATEAKFEAAIGEYRMNYLLLKEICGGKID